MYLQYSFHHLFQLPGCRKRQTAPKREGIDTLMITWDHVYRLASRKQNHETSLSLSASRWPTSVTGFPLFGKFLIMPTKIRSCTYSTEGRELDDGSAAYYYLTTHGHVYRKLRDRSKMSSDIELW